MYGVSDAVILQQLVNDYLRYNGKKTITDILADNGKKEEIGVITPAHKIVLQQMVYQFVKKQGRNINDEIESGHQVLGVLSKTEVKYVDVLLSMYQISIEKSHKMVV